MKSGFKRYTVLLFLLTFILNTCENNPFSSDKDSKPLTNQAPETFLFLFLGPDSSDQDSLSTPRIATTPSKQIVHWWGDDPDGYIIGYYYQWDYQSEKVWTTAEYDTFYVPIRTSYDEFTLQVWAVDNDSLMDPTPAVQIFPVFNSFPEISFKNRSNPQAPDGSPEVTAYTFPTRTFMWDAEDPDGVETITGIYYALDDTSSWIALPGGERSITLTEIPPGEHRFFVKAEDIAGAQSNIISFPDPEDDTVPNHWVVKETKGDVLLVNDFAQDQNTGQVQGFYENLLQAIAGADGYSVWQIGTSRVPMINPQNSLPYATADIKANLGYFKKVVWFSHLGRPNLTAAGLSITQYIADGGNIFITNANEETPDTTWTFTSIDSVYRLNPGGRMLPGVMVDAKFTSTAEDSLLNLEVAQLIGNRVSALVPGPGADVVYAMESDTVATVPVPYKGTPAVGIRYRVGSGESIYFSLPFHYCDGKNNIEDVLRYILEEEFAQ
ncbi:MAG: hypothetical protein E4H13_09600 [Calditrichales bacterium]|nr:MAG: hypothetical protein E4H13_09600 [Calditrichales bacterium]